MRIPTLLRLTNVAAKQRAPWAWRQPRVDWLGCRIHIHSTDLACERDLGTKIRHLSCGR